MPSVDHLTTFICQVSKKARELKSPGALSRPVQGLLYMRLMFSET